MEELEQPNEYIRNHPHFVEGREYGRKEERLRLIKQLLNLAETMADGLAPRSAKAILLAVDVLEGRV